MRCSPPGAASPSHRVTRAPSSPRSGWRSWTGNRRWTGPSWSGCCAGSGCAAWGRSARWRRQTWRRGSGRTPCSRTGWPAAWTRVLRCAGGHLRSWPSSWSWTRPWTGWTPPPSPRARWHSGCTASSPDTGCPAPASGSRRARWRGRSCAASGAAPSRSPRPARRTGSAGSSTPGSSGVVAGRWTGCGWSPRRRSPRARCNWGCGAMSGRRTSGRGARWSGCRRCSGRRRWSPRCSAVAGTPRSRSGWCPGGTTAVSPQTCSRRSEAATPGPVGVPPRRRAAVREPPPPWPGRLPPPSPAVVPPEPLPADLRDVTGQPVQLAAPDLLTAPPCTLAVDDGPPEEVRGWAGPWPVAQRWWVPGAVAEAGSRCSARTGRRSCCSGAPADGGGGCL